MPTANVNAQLRNAELGWRVALGTPKTLPLNATQTVFTITGGRIMVALLLGVVTTIVGGTTPAVKYVATPTTGTANDMCTALTVTTDEVGMQWCLPIAVGSALIGAASTGKSGSASGPGLGGQIVAPGTIGFNCSAADATGAATHTLYYIPLDAGVGVAAN